MRATLTTILFWLALLTTPGLAQDAAFLKNGLQVQGTFAPVAGICEAPSATPPQSIDDVPQLLVTFVDDRLRRTFFHKNNLATAPRPIVFRPERIRLAQDVQSAGRRVAGIGSMIPGPFDDRGRRLVTMRDADGMFHVLQGITEVNPTCLILEGLAGENPYQWTMSVATSSAPAAELNRFFASHLDQGNLDERLRVVRLYAQADRYKDARDELMRAIQDFSEIAELQDQLNALNQQWAKQLVQEIKVRADSAGQHQLAYRMLKTFPAEGVATETLLEVRSMLRDYENRLKQQEEVRQGLQRDIAQLVEDERRVRAQAVLDEWESELNIETLKRLDDYLRLMNDPDLTPDRKVALAMGGWILGSGAGVQNLDVAASLYRLRELTAQYLECPSPQERERLLQQIDLLEGVSPPVVARLLANMKPPAANDDLKETQHANRYEVSVPVEGLLKQDEIHYIVQLPEQYEPYRRYPCIVALHGAANSPESEMEWWLGGFGRQREHAARRGYIVIAPKWMEQKQSQYGYTAREHASVLHAVRDAFRRFSVDTDRVFLSGHFQGADAAWDIGLSHPDLWAGVAPIVGRADKYIVRYWKNAAGMPWYFVGGDLDAQRLKDNCSTWDRLLRSGRYDSLVVLYQGRGENDFRDELPRLMAWMQEQRRTMARQKFSCDAMRSWDNFFWWVEVSDYPDRSNVPPLAWPQEKSREATTSGEALPSNAVRVNTDANQATVYLLPGLVRIDEEVLIFLNGKRFKAPPPSIQVMLEDARTRCDRLNPFWSKLEARANRR